MTNESVDDVYELTLTLRISAASLEAARSAANALVLSGGLAAGRLQIMDCGPGGIGEGVLVFAGPGSSHATIDGLFEEEPQANLDSLWETREPSNDTQR